MFSVINEIKDNSPSKLLAVVTSSIGSAACIYVVVSITGYITFGNDVVGNIVSMCKLTHDVLLRLASILTMYRPYWSRIDHWQSRNCHFSFVFHSSPSSPMPCITRCSIKVATKPSAESWSARISFVERAK